MAGYSGTPLLQKLGLKPSLHVSLPGLPDDVQAELQQALATCQVATSGPLDFAMLFVKTEAELEKQFPRLAKRLKPAGMLWVRWPKKTSGVVRLTEGEVRRIGLRDGPVDVKVCAVSEVWSGLRFVVRLKDRGKKS